MVELLRSIAKALQSSKHSPVVYRGGASVGSVEVSSLRKGNPISSKESFKEINAKLRHPAFTVYSEKDKVVVTTSFTTSKVNGGLLSNKEALRIYSPRAQFFRDTVVATNINEPVYKAGKLVGDTKYCFPERLENLREVVSGSAGIKVYVVDKKESVFLSPKEFDNILKGSISWSAGGGPISVGANDDH